MITIMKQNKSPFGLKKQRYHYLSSTNPTTKKTLKSDNVKIIKDAYPLKYMDAGVARKLDAIYHAFAEK